MDKKNGVVVSDKVKDYICRDEALMAEITVRAPERCCLFCKHCTDVFWDFSHGPYMMLCDIHEDVTDGAKGQCDDFKEETNEDN